MAYRPKYRAAADVGLMLLFGFAGGIVFLLLVNAVRRYAMGIADAWWPDSPSDNKGFLTFILGAAPAWALLRFGLYRRWKWPPYD